MACVRCGAVFDGSFCPRCGAPAAASPTSFAAPPALVGWPCPRCGTLFSGNFCPRCGLPMGAWAARPPPRSSMRPVLSILWTLALVAFVAFAVTSYSGPTPWTSTGRIGADARLTSRGLYYLKIAFIVDAASGPVDVGIDNARLAWTTDAAVVLYIPVPLPYVVILSQDKTFFLSYYGLIAAAIFLVGAYHAVRERKETSRAFTAPIESIGTRLRSRSAWIAIAQVCMAVKFFQVALIYLLTLAGIEPTSPINLTPQNAWVLLFELANAGVYEEVIFRLLLISLPMAIGSVVLRIMDVNRVASGNGL